MIPFYSNAPFALHDRGGETTAIPYECFDSRSVELGDDVQIVRGKFFARLSAPGYLDATDWMGPFDSIAEARAAIVEAFDVCPWCGAYSDDLDVQCCTCEADAARLTEEEL